MLAGFAAGCTTSDRTTTNSPTVERAKQEADDAAKRAEIEAREAKAAINRRIDQLDEKADELAEKSKKATAKARAKMQREGEELKVEAKRLRAQMSTWDDKADSAWRTTKREVEEALDKTEAALKKMVD
ncbi:hypothetical protein F183_A10980 [Bryobacterales bacterium F-183]|nr:hypothetical protein F183_A10980 [Bryobacterales bacterium F-183]